MTQSWEDPRVVDGLARQFATREAALRRGARHIGWKVGFGAPGSLRLMRIESPLVGYLTDATVIEPGTTVNASAWRGGIVEFETAVYMGRDVVGGMTSDEAAEAVAAIGPAIELADITFKVDADRLGDVLEANVFHRNVIFGGADETRRGLDIDGLSIVIEVDGRTGAEVTHLEEITGVYADIVRTVADTLAACGLALRQGDVIITGSVIPPIPITDGTHFRLRMTGFDPIGVAID